MSEWKHIGMVGVDSGQLIVCDPCYIDSEWEYSEYKDIRLYKNKITGKLYGYYTLAASDYVRNNKLDVTFFDHYMSILEDGFTPNFYIENKTWEDFSIKVDNTFSYNGVSHKEDAYKQINYKLGHPGLAVSFETGFGDGCYPVFAKFQHGRIAEIVIKFFDDEDDEEDEESEEDNGE